MGRNRNWDQEQQQAIAPDQTFSIPPSDISSRWKLTSLVMLCLLTLTACNFGFDSKKVGESIQKDIVKNGGTSLKTVTCPGGIKPEAGKTFECVGEMDNGYTFTIVVQQQDNKGTVAWDVPQAKGLLNIPNLESLMQASLTTEIGAKPAINCGGIYKAVKPGERFECQLSYKMQKPAPKAVAPKKGKPAPASKPVEITQTEKISISTDGEGNVSWQRILPSLAAQPAAAPPSKNSANSEDPKATD